MFSTWVQSIWGEMNVLDRDIWLLFLIVSANCNEKYVSSITRPTWPVSKNGSNWQRVFLAKVTSY